MTNLKMTDLTPKCTDLFDTILAEIDKKIQQAEDKASDLKNTLDTCHAELSELQQEKKAIARANYACSAALEKLKTALVLTSQVPLGGTCLNYEYYLKQEIQKILTTTVTELVVLDRDEFGYIIPELIRKRLGENGVIIGELVVDEKNFKSWILRHKKDSHEKCLPGDISLYQALRGCDPTGCWNWVVLRKERECRLIWKNNADTSESTKIYRNDGGYDDGTGHHGMMC